MDPVQITADLVVNEAGVYSQKAKLKKHRFIWDFTALCDCVSGATFSICNTSVRFTRPLSKMATCALRTMSDGRKRVFLFAA